MSYFPTDDQRILRETAAHFARKEVAPIAEQIDREEHTPSELTQRAAEFGLFGLCIPTEYGGSDAGLTSACIALEEIGKASPSFAGMLSVQVVLCPLVISLLGTQEQKQRILPRSATGERLMALSQTEPAGAINITEHQTRLTPDAGGWLLNGAKLFCTQGEAKTYLVMCRTKRAGTDGYGCVILEQGAKGFSVAPYEDKLGWRGTNTGSISFADVAIAEQDVVGDLITAGVDFMPAYNSSILSHSAAAIGGAQGMFDKTLAYTKERRLYGSPMTQLSPINTWIGEVQGKIEAARALLYTATRLADEGRRDFPVMGSVCKAFICETAFQCCSTLLQMWGGSGIMNSTGVNRYFRDARANLIAEAPTEYHHWAVASYVLGDLRAHPKG